ncbi:MAG TPA: YceI family protein [Planctomycetota bacterium]|nr:YceI family protein [Planctomycetota bacterium]
MKKVFALAFAVALAAPVLAGDKYKVDPVHTTVHFKVSHMNAGRYIGRFNDTSGTVEWDSADPSKSKIEVEVAVESLDTHQEGREKHLKGPEFFNAKQFPKITFKSTKIEKDGEKYKMTGDLALHGETHPVTTSFEITGKAKDPKGVEHVGGEAIFKVKRSEWGMKEHLDMIGDEVEMTVEIEAAKE